MTAVCALGLKEFSCRISSRPGIVLSSVTPVLGLRHQKWSDATDREYAVWRTH